MDPRAVSTQFFERQEVQRSYTRWLVAGFVTALLLVTAVITLVIVIGFMGNPLPAFRSHPGSIVSIALGLIVFMLLGVVYQRFPNAHCTCFTSSVSQ